MGIPTKAAAASTESVGAMATDDTPMTEGLTKPTVTRQGVETNFSEDAIFFGLIFRILRSYVVVHFLK